MSKPESWKMWEGRSVAGKFPLRQWLGGSITAPYSSRKAGSGAKAAIKLIAVEAGAAEQELFASARPSELSHPHLIRIFRGRTRPDRVGTRSSTWSWNLPRRICRRVLPQRALSPEEVSDLLPPCWMRFHTAQQGIRAQPSQAFEYSGGGECS